jgi:hypothetical protein
MLAALHEIKQEALDLEAFAAAAAVRWAVDEIQPPIRPRLEFQK